MRAAWIVDVALLAVAGLIVWHVTLLWLFRDRLSLLGGGILGILACVFAGRALARRVAQPARSALMRHAARLDWVGFVFIAFLLTLLLLFHLGFDRAASDGRSYFVQVRSLVMDWDLDFANEAQVFGAHTARQYAFGAPVLWSPFFLLAHLWLLAANLLGADLAVDGYALPYQRAIGLATLIYGFVGLVLVYRVVRGYFPKGVACLSTLGLCGTSFLIWYLTVENSMVHGVSMFATTLFLFLWHRYRSQLTRARWAWLGAAAGLMATVRWQNAVFLALPVGDLLWTAWASGGPGVGDRLRGCGRDVAIFAAAALLAFFPQLAFWKAVYGSWIYIPVREHAFEPTWIPPYLADVLFSANHGLLSWSPVVIAALVGLLLFARREWRVALVLGAGFIGQLWVNGAVEIWWGGAGFGARRFANCALVFAMGLAGLLGTLQRRPLVAPVMAMCALLVFNVVFIVGYRSGTVARVEGVTFVRVIEEFYERLGNPFSFPAGAYVAWRYDVGLPVYDRLRGRTYNNLTIDVGGEDDHRFLGHGWAARERHPRYTFRWADAETSTVLVPLKTDVDNYVLELECGPFTVSGFPPQTVEVRVNDLQVATLTLREGMHTYRVDVPSHALRPNLNQLRLRYGYAVAPASVAASNDRRRLAVRVATIRLLRQLTS